eukprot:4335898-Alexandrium_andersonii.AAC.1
MARQGRRCLVPESWVGPEESEMVDPLPENARSRDPVRAGTREDHPRGYDTMAWVPTSDPQ